MAETYDFAKGVLKDTVDVDLDYRRMSRSSDQSFWGHGIPTVLASLSEQSAEDSEMFKTMASLLGGGTKGGGLGWWWHTTEDTLDKIDADFLVRDAKVYAETMWRICTAPRLPLDIAALADEIGDAVKGYQESAKGSIDLSGTIEMAAALSGKIRALDLNQVSPERANQLLMDLDRILLPVNFTANGPFEQDLALGTVPVPGLREVGQLASYESGERRFQIPQDQAGAAAQPHRARVACGEPEGRRVRVIAFTRISREQHKAGAHKVLPYGNFDQSCREAPCVLPLSNDCAVAELRIRDRSIYSAGSRINTGIVRDVLSS